MNIWKITIQNIKSKPLYTLLSVFTLSLSIALLLGIQQLKTSFEYQMENNLGDIDLVIGAKGSPLQLVLSSVLHLDNPTGNIKYGDAKKIGEHPMVSKAVPISYGDNYKGYRIVGAGKGFDTFYNAEIQQGNAPQKSMEVVLGHAVAEKLQLNIGDTLSSSHGLVENDIEVHEEEFTVVGIYKPTQKVIDGLIVTNLESVWHVHDHDHNHDDETREDALEHDDNGHHHHDEDQHDEEANHEHDHDHHDDEKEVTALLISFRNQMALLTLPREINENTTMQAALPKYELNKLYQFTGIGFKTISWIAYVILIISGLTIFISLYKMIKERAFDLALLRSYGASNVQLVKMVIYEGLVIVCVALVIGFFLAKAGLYVLFNVVEGTHQKVMLQELPVDQMLQIIGLVFVMILLSVVLAIYPIVKMNISTILSNERR